MHTNISMSTTSQPYDPHPIPKSTAIQALNSIIQLHFDKTLEKKHSIDKQKKHLSHPLLLFLLLLSLILLLSPLQPRLQCRHLWAPLALLSISHLAFDVAVAQTLRCFHGLKYQRRCHRLTLGVATERLRTVRREEVVVGELEVKYQEPDERYLGKFMRNWAVCFGFLLCTFVVSVFSSVHVLCF